MTAAKLTLIIVSGLTVQILLVAGLALWRRVHAPKPALAAAVPVPAKPAAGWDGWRELQVVHRAYEDAAATICSFYLQAVDDGDLPPFLPGQYLTFKAPPDADGKARTRCYSLSDIGDGRRYRISVKRVPWDAQAGTPMPVSVAFHEQLQVGSRLQARAPMGRFTLDTASNRPVVLIAGGIGITPLLSMLQWLLANQPKRPVHLFYGARNAREMAFRTVIEDWAARYPQFQRHLLFDSPEPGDSELPGVRDGRFITVELLKRELPYGPAQFYLCGPNAMMQAMTDGLRGWGVAAKDIHLEAFGPSALANTTPIEAPADAAASYPVAFTRSGVNAVWDGRDANLLELSERVGVDIANACRAGNCGTCETKIAKGEVRYAEPPDFPVQDGHCLPCVCRPAGELALEA